MHHSTSMNWLVLTPSPLGDVAVMVFRLIIQSISSWSSPCEFALKGTPQNVTKEKSTLVQVMAWCRHRAPSHYVRQCWHRSVSRNGVNMPQCVNHRSTAKFHEVSSAILKNVFWSTKTCSEAWPKILKNMIFSVNIVPVDKLAPLDAMPSVTCRKSDDKIW